jgi:hypothetical protein
MLDKLNIPSDGFSVMDMHHFLLSLRFTTVPYRVLGKGTLDPVNISSCCTPIKKPETTLFSFGSSAMLLDLSTRRFPPPSHEEFGFVGKYVLNNNICNNCITIIDRAQEDC